MLGIDDYIQATIAVFLITDPIGKAVFFHLLMADTPAKKVKSALTVATVVALILGVAAFAGQEILDLINIHLGAFGFTGGVIVALMGLEMMGTGAPSRAQGSGGALPHPSPDDSLLVPFAMPLIAGPGAITVVITLAAKTNSYEATVMTLIAIGINVALLLLCCIALEGVLGRLSDRAVSLFTRFGGLIVATIGVQLAFGGIKKYFGI